MSSVSCDLCQGSDCAVETTFDGWRLVKCGNCGLKWLEPKPDSETCVRLYDQHYFNSHEAKLLGYSSYEDRFRSKIRTFNFYLRQIEAFHKPGTSLDVGCAFGYFIRAAQARGWNAHRINISTYAVEQAAKTRLPVKCGDFLQCRCEESYDLVTAWDLIEHMLSPHAFFSQAWHMLKDGGILGLTTPDSQSLVARLWGRRWYQYKLPEHIYYLNRATITAYCRELGFVILCCRKAVKFRSLPDALARGLGLYESKRLSHSFVGKVLVPYPSLCEIFLLAQKRNPQAH